MSINCADPFDPFYIKCWQENQYAERLFALPNIFTGREGVFTILHENYQAYCNALTRMPYDKYLQTPHWKWLRSRALHKADYRCQVCNSRKSLEVHHRTYQSIPFETHPHHSFPMMWNEAGKDEDFDHNDLIVLCNDCHALFHHKQPKPEAGGEPTAEISIPRHISTRRDYPPTRRRKNQQG